VTQVFRARLILSPRPGAVIGADAVRLVVRSGAGTCASA